jgi:predicted RNase H-like nuclease
MAARSEAAFVAGADVAKGRWVVVVLDNGSFAGATVLEHLLQLRGRLGVPALLGLDIPIGLPAGGGSWPRPADLEARELVGPRRSSVFLSPPLPVLAELEYAAANARHRALTGKGLSRQTWGLRERILEAAAYVAEFPDVIEAHPEACFAGLKGAPLEHAKKSWNGQMERRALLAADGIELPDRLDAQAGEIPPDDVLDAAVVARTAWRCLRGEAGTLPACARGAPITERGVIWY